MKYDREIKRYLNDISHMIPAEYPNKEQILYDLGSDLRSYAEERADIVWQDMIEEFGTAAAVAGSVLGDVADTSILSFAKQKKWRYRLLIATIAALIAVMIVLLVYRYYWIKFESYQVNPTVYIYNGTEVSSEEFDEKMETD